MLEAFERDLGFRILEERVSCIWLRTSLAPNASIAPVADQMEQSSGRV